MYSLNRKEDLEDDFPLVSESRTNLATLFDSDPDNSKSANLKYIPPKPPSNSKPLKPKPQAGMEDSKSTKDQTNILFATTTNLYSHQDGFHKNEGKMMCCITRNNAQGNFALLIYKSSKQVIVQSVITQKFALEIHPKNYLSFYEKNIRWSFHINGTKYEQFLTQIGICRAFSMLNPKTTTPWVVQSLCLGEGANAKDKDIVKISKSLWKVNNFKKGDLIEDDPEPVTFTLNKPVSSWEMALVGCQNNHHLLVLVPRKQANEAMATNLVAYDVKVENLSSPLDRPNPDAQQGKDANKKGPADAKASLISRMAKVGQPMFPQTNQNEELPVEADIDLDDFRFPSRSRCTSVASSIEEINTSGVKRNERKISEGGPGIDSNSLPTSGSYPYNVLPHGSLISYHSVPFQQMHPTTASNVSSDPILSLLLSESRSQNTDLRISLSKLTDKIDDVSCKVTSLESTSGKDRAIESPARKYDPDDLYNRIVALIEENRQFEEQVKMKDEKIESISASLTDMMLKNQKLLEDKTELIMEKGTIQTKVDLEATGTSLLQQHKSELETKLLVSEDKIEDLEAQLEEAKLEAERSNDINCELMNLKAQINDQISKLQDKLLASEEEYAKLSIQMKTYNGYTEESEAKIKQLKNQLKCEELKWEEMEREENNVRVDLAKEKSENKVLQTQNERLTAQNLQLSTDNKKQKTLRNDDYSKNQRNTQELVQKQLLIDQLEEDVRRLQEVLSTEKRESGKLICELKGKMTSFEEDLSKKPDTNDIVKKIMNLVYKKMKSVFQPAQNYEGEIILNNVLVVIRDTTLQYLETTDEDTKKATNKPCPQKDSSNPIKSTTLTAESSVTTMSPKIDFVLSRQDHIDKSLSQHSRADYTSTDDQQSETSLGSYEILPNDDSESKVTSTTLTDGKGVEDGGSGQVQQSNSSLAVVDPRGKKFNTLRYKIGASSSCETPDEFQESTSHDYQSEEESTLKSLSESSNKNIQPPNDFADQGGKEQKNGSNQQQHLAPPPPPPPLFSDSENDDDFFS